MTYRGRMRNVVVADEFSALPVMSGREWHYFFAKSDQIFGFAGKDGGAVPAEAVIEGAYAYRVTRRNIFAGFRIIYYKRKLGVEHREHICAVFAIHRQKYFTVRTAFEGVFRFEGGFQLFKAVYLAVAHDIASVKLKRLHPFRSEPHYGKTVESEQTFAGVYYPAVVRSS